MIRQVILRGLGRIVHCISGCRSRFIQVIVSTSIQRGGHRLTRGGGGLVRLRGHVKRLSAVFRHVCRSGVANGLSSRQFVGVSGNCRSRRRALRTRTSGVRGRLRRRRGGDISIGHFLTVMGGCASLARLAPRVLQRFISGVVIRTPSGDDNEQLRRVRVVCGRVKRFSRSGIAL